MLYKSDFYDHLSLPYNQQIKCIVFHCVLIIRQIVEYTLHVIVEKGPLTIQLFLHRQTNTDFEFFFHWWNIFNNNEILNKSELKCENAHEWLVWIYLYDDQVKMCYECWQERWTFCMRKKFINILLIIYFNKYFFKSMKIFEQSILNWSKIILWITMKIKRRKFPLDKTLVGWKVNKKESK